MNADKIRPGLETATHKLRERGFEPDLALTTTEEAAAGEVAAALDAMEYESLDWSANRRSLP
jgi:hypothetical protein